MNKVNVNIYGHEYTLVSEKPKEFILKVASFVDDEINKTSKTLVNWSKTDILILACNNIAEHYFDLLDNPDTTSQQELFNKIDTLNRELASVKLQNEQKDIKIKSLEMTDMNSESLKAKIEKVKSDYEEKLNQSNQKIEECEKINSELESKFFELQIKLAQKEEELKNIQSQSETETNSQE